MIDKAVPQQPPTIELGERWSTRALQQARCTGAEVRISAETGSPAASGSISELTEESLEFTLRRDVQGNCWMVAGRCCDVAFTVAEDHFGFDSVIRSVERREGRTHVVVERPNSIWVRQRRRFWRTLLRESSTVSLKFLGESTVCEGAVLNISSDGMACRVDRNDADGLRIGDQLEARFGLECEADPFVIVSALKGKTPSADDGCIILRLQFVPSAMSENDRKRIDRATRLVGEPV